MLEVLSKVAAQVLAKLIDASVDVGRRKVEFRRSVAGAFMDLFDAYSRLVSASAATIQAFEVYQEREIATKGEIQRHIGGIGSSFEDFLAALARVESRLQVYDRDLLFELKRVVRAKRDMLIRVDLLAEVAPLQVEGSHRVSYLRNVPNTEALRAQMLDVASSNDIVLPEGKRDWTSDSLERLNLEDLIPRDDVAALKRRLKKKLSRQTVNLLKSDQAKTALATGHADVKRLADTRDALAAFIRGNFPLDGILR